MNIQWAKSLRATLVIGLVIFTSACTVVSTTNKRSTDEESAADFNAKLGAQYLQRGDLQLANEKLTKALEQDKNNANAHINMAKLQFAIDKPDVARRHYKRAMSLEPDNADNRNAYGIFLCQTGDPIGAEREFDRAANNPFYETPEFALDNAGVCMLEAGRFDEAEDYLTKAIRRNPKFANAYLHIAELRYSERRLTIADAYLARYHALNDFSPASLLLGFEIQREGGYQTEAKQFADLLLNKFPDSTEAGAYLARPR